MVMRHACMHACPVIGGEASYYGRGGLQGWATLERPRDKRDVGTLSPLALLKRGATPGEGVGEGEG